MRITRSSNGTLAGVIYAANVFVVGFGLGTLRVLVVVPRLGDTLAVTLEAPVMLLASWEFSRRLIKRFDVPAQARARLLMGTIGFSVLMVAEIGVSVFIFRRPVGDYWASYESIPGIIGLAAQIAFAAIPLLQLRCHRRQAPVA